MNGTVSRLGVWVRGTCPTCGDEDVFVYDADGDLLCAADYRAWSAANPQQQQCDVCGATGNVWRDPLTRKNEYFCIRHHDPDALFQNRWANKVRESTRLGQREKVKCGAAGITECRGEIKWRGAFNMLVCNKHAGKAGVGPNG